MSEERKTKTDAAAPASAALERIDRKDAFLQALHTFLTAHQGTEWAVAAVDIQHFKLYNELYGTEKGDALLETVANCLLGYSKQTGYPVGYFGNDDFFLCLPDEKAEQTAVLATLQACMNAGRQDVTFFVVMGVCPMQANPGADAATLCNYAQIAGVTTDSGYLHRFEPTMLNELKEQQQLLGELEHALDNHEFCFFLQPKCNSITRAIVGMEALVRWNHPTRGCVPPAEFMPLLERTGLVTRLDQYIWESVCQTLQKWQESGSNLVPVSVNVSVQDILNLDVPQIFADLVEKYKLEPKLLLAEITETMVAEDTQMVESAIQGLHRKGFSVMMDDFGSGYSSLNMLKDTNVDAIKLDMKLIEPKNLGWKILDILPEVLNAGEDAGVLTEEGAKKLDPSGTLKAGTPLCPPEGDAGTGMVATNAVRQRTGNVSAGTSSFSMIVLEKALSQPYEVIDMVTTPDGSPVAMVHCNNCTSDLNAWVGLFKQYQELLGVPVDMNEVFGKLYNHALEGDADCGGLIAYNYISGEPVTGLAEGRPMFVRSANDKFNLANFMRANLYASVAVLKIGNDVLFKDEKVQVDRITGHGGLFKTKGVGQRILAAAINSPISVMETAGEGGAWGIALLAGYLVNNEEKLSLADYLDKKVFAGNTGVEIAPTAEDVAGFDAYIETYKAGLAIEQAAVANKK